MSNARALDDVFIEGATNDNPFIALFSQLALARSDRAKAAPESAKAINDKREDGSPLKRFEELQGRIEEANENPAYKDDMGYVLQCVLAEVLGTVNALPNLKTRQLADFGIRSSQDVPYVSEVLLRIVGDAIEGRLGDLWDPVELASR